MIVTDRSVTNGFVRDRVAREEESIWGWKVGPNRDDEPGAISMSESTNWPGALRQEQKMSRIRETKRRKREKK